MRASFPAQQIRLSLWASSIVLMVAACSKAEFHGSNTSSTSSSAQDANLGTAPAAKTDTATQTESGPILAGSSLLPSVASSPEATPTASVSTNTPDPCETTRKLVSLAMITALSKNHVTLHGAPLQTVNTVEATLVQGGVVVSAAEAAALSTLELVYTFDPSVTFPPDFSMSAWLVRSNHITAPVSPVAAPDAANVLKISMPVPVGYLSSAPYSTLNGVNAFYISVSGQTGSCNLFATHLYLLIQ